MAQSPTAADRQAPALTIYNGNFALVREYIPLELTSGVNTVSFTEVTSHLEPDSVILRDPDRTALVAGAGAELSRRSRLAGVAALAL